MEKSIELNGCIYDLREESTEYVIVRTYSAGVYYGLVSWRNENNPKNLKIKKARRIRTWKGALDLSQLAQEGTAYPNDCKFPGIVNEVELTEVIEIIPISEKALKTLNSVPVWKI